MVRFLAVTALRLLANAVGLLVAAAILDGFTLDALTFLVVVLVFTAVEVIVDPLMIKMSLTYAPVLRGGVALVTTFVGLVVVTLVTDGLTISGFTTWVLGTLIVWLAGVLAAIILPLFLFRKATGRQRGARA